MGDTRRLRGDAAAVAAAPLPGAAGQVKRREIVTLGPRAIDPGREWLPVTRAEGFVLFWERHCGDDVGATCRTAKMCVDGPSLRSMSSVLSKLGRFLSWPSYVEDNNTGLCSYSLKAEAGVVEGLSMV